MPYFTLKPLLGAFFLGVCYLLVEGGASAEADVFAAFTAHIHHQVQADKRMFVAAQICTEWFYRQIGKKPPKATIESITFRPGAVANAQFESSSDCPRRYPDGLEGARKDFSLTQSSLSVSLTFYEFALVGDRNDDAQYNQAELQDMLEAFGLPFNEALPSSAHLAVLNAQFDRIRTATGLETLMTGMGILYDRGYRFTPQDRAALNQIAG
ncbi:MAG TPA: hypothetical protein VJ692_12310 [Nitrospiraceae bacterium]|nr:hypothetical protein [Nitrospiraceae bacterium]